MLLCTTCKQEKPESEFHLNRTLKRGYAYACRDCHNARLRAKYATPEARAAKKEYNRQLFERLKDKPDATILERFAAKVRKDESGCHIWTGSINFDGYGQIWYRGTIRRAHRVAWVMAGGTLPEWPLVLDHACKNRACVNVAHLRIVEQTENVQELADRSKMHERIRETQAANEARGEKVRVYRRPDAGS